MQARPQVAFHQVDFLRLLQSHRKENTPGERRLQRAFLLTLFGPRVANSRAFGGPTFTTLLLEFILPWSGAVGEE